MLGGVISLSCDWCVVHEDQRKNTMKTNVVKKHDYVFKRILNYYTLKNKDNWEGVCTQSRKQHTCTSDKHN